MAYHISWEGTCYNDFNVILASDPLGRELESGQVDLRQTEADPHASGRALAEGLRSIDAGQVRFLSIDQEAGLVRIGALRWLGR